MSTTDGGRANGMPRKWFVPLAVAPMNVPLSSVTIGPVEYFVTAAKTVAVAAHIVTRNSRRKAMTAKNTMGELQGLAGQRHMKGNSLYVLVFLADSD